jgi:hypothetical protein
MLPKIRIKPVLAPTDRVLEVLAGVIMVLTFTNVLSVSHVDKADERAMLIGSLGCNLAWGIIDGIMYLMNSLATRGRELAALALRLSNLVAISLLFLTGYVFGRHIGHSPWRLGIVMVVIGCLLTGVAISLGG